MNNISKSSSIVLILIMAITSLNIIMVESASAQSIPKPSTPEFTVNLADHSYDIPPTTTTRTNPYNNKTTTITSPRYHVENITIDLTIKNQLYPATINGNKSNLYYNIRMKGHFGEDWIYRYPSFPVSASSSGDTLSGDYSNALPKQSSSQYTVFSFSQNYHSGDEVDFQVEAILGYQYSFETYYYNNDVHLLPVYVESFVYKSSSWSPTQTFTMHDTPASNSPSPTPTVPEFSCLMILPLFLSLLFIVVLFRKRKFGESHD